jgi:hypothetical protein
VVEEVLACLSHQPALRPALPGEFTRRALLNGKLGLLEADGFLATGHLAHPILKGLLRTCRDTDGNPIFKSGPSLGQKFATGELDGASVLYPMNGALVSSTAYDIAGQWDQLVYAMRQDVTYTVADQGVIQDGAGNIVYNLFQQDMVALRIVMRLGFAVPNPINRMNQTAGTRCAFAALTA